jgi:hypothetical protein
VTETGREGAYSHRRPERPRIYPAHSSRETRAEPHGCVKPSVNTVVHESFFALAKEGLALPAAIRLAAGGAFADCAST